MKRFFVCLGIMSLLVSPGAALAGTAESDDHVVVSKDKPLTDDFYAAGDNVVIDGTVTGDVVAVGKTVKINGNVNGNVWAAAETVEIHGSVTGSVRAAGSRVVSDGIIGGDLLAAGETVEITQGSVGRDVWTAGGDIRIAGTVGRNLKASGGEVTIENTIAGKADISVGKKDGSGNPLVLSEKAAIKGPLDYRSPTELEQRPGATVTGPVSYTQGDDESENFLDRLSDQTYWFLASIALLIGILLYARRAAWIASQNLTERPGWSLLSGLLFIILAPVVMLILFVLIIGIPLSLLTAALYVTVLYTAKVFVALLLGRLLIQRQPESFFPSAAAGILGLAFIYTMMAVPVLGPVIMMLTVIMGTGAQVLLARQLYASVRPTFGS